MSGVNICGTVALSVEIPCMWSCNISNFSVKFINSTSHRTITCTTQKHVSHFTILALPYLSSCLHCSEIVFQAAVWYELH